MALPDPKTPTRAQLFKLLGSHELVKIFEKLFEVAGDLTPTEIAALSVLIQETSIDANTAVAKANQAIGALASIDHSRLKNILWSLAGHIIDTVLQMNGNTIAGDTVSGGNLTFTSTSHATKGAINFSNNNLINSIIDDFSNIVHADNIHIRAIASAGTIPKGKAVYAFGYDAGLDALKVKLSDNDDSDTMPAIGITSEELNTIEARQVTGFGNIENVDTSSWNVGDSLWVDSTLGELTNIRPMGASEDVQKIAKVLRKHATTGRLLVQGAGRTNDVPNTIPTILKEGSVVFSDGTNFVEDNSNFFWDDANNRLGINTTNPSEKLHVVGNILADTGDLILPKTSGKGIKIDAVTPTFGWRDLEGYEIPDPTGGDRPTLSVYSGGSIKENAFSNGDVLRIRYHIPHDYVKGTDIFSHIHWSHNGTAISGNVVFGVTSDYAKGHNQGNFGNEKAISITYNTINIATTPQYRHRIEEEPITSDGGSATLIDRGLLEPDGIILVTFVLTTNPTITGGSPNNVFVHRADLHYQSSNIATKDKIPDFYT